MVEHSLRGVHSSAPIRIDGGNLSRRMCSEILFSGERPRPLKDGFRAFDIAPNRLTLPMLLGVCAPLKNPVLASAALHLLVEIGRPLYAPGLSGLGFPDGLPALELSGAQLQDVRHS